MAVSDPSHDALRSREAEARIGRLYREAAVEQPPGHVDRAIAVAARKRADDAARKSALHLFRLWHVPFAVAAVAIVSVSVVTLMMERESPSTASAPPPVASVTSDPAPPAPAALSTQPSELERPPPAPSPAPRREDTAAAGSSASSRVASRASSNESIQNTTPLADRAAATESSSATEQSAPIVGHDVQSGTDVARAQPEPLQLERQAQVSPAPAAAAKPAPSRSTAALQSDPSASPRSNRKSEAPHELAGSSARARPGLSRHVVELENRPPAAWLERVISLRREGQHADAETLFAEFRRRFPAEPLPPELR